MQQMCQIFKPLLSKSGRIVNVSSTGSSLGQYSEEIQQRFRSSNMTLQDLEDLMEEYQVLNDSFNKYLHEGLITDRNVPTMVPNANTVGHSKHTASAKRASMR